ncbi:MAG: sulfatase-like hydrolase/transferase [Bacillota bacterium]|nr:sulfatase-like hydrolase/transferase [Bacillota bacterium]
MEKLKEILKKINNNHILMLFIMAVVIDLIIESLGRLSPVAALAFMVGHPLVFFCNTMLIMATISLALLFRRRIFAACMFSFVWLAIGITNGVILINRMTPFNVKDLATLSEAQSIMTNYFSVKSLIMIGVGAAVFVLAIILLFRKTPKLAGKVDYRKSAISVILIIGIALGSITGGMKLGILDTFFPNLAYAYRDNGVAYSFMITWVKTGIDKPKGYSEEMIEGIFTGGELGDDNIYTPGEDDDKNVQNKPNIIFVQLESFVDPTIVNDVEFSKDPIPNFRKMLKTCSSGYLTVPAVGAGTANVEFEAMTGISARFFGPGEYPYKSVLTEKTCESVPYDLKQIGYSAHAIHNHRGAFYNRNKVFKNLGFDTFTCLEYMNNVVKTPKNWAKDALLTENIIDALESTEGPDYIYTISVQGHGKYPTEQVIQDPAIEVTKAPNDEKKWGYEYYANQIYEMDIFIKEMTQVLETYDEDVVLVLYGDHLPALDMTEDELKTGDLYKTQYVIWSNFGLEKQDEDVAAYEISYHLLDRLGISTGMMTKFHQNYEDSDTYKQDLEALSYDMLYGKDYIYGGTNPFKPTKMQMGVKEIKIDSIVKIGDKYYIKGENFTEYSKISLDGEVLKTVYLGPTILALNEDVDPKDVSKMKVSQVEKNKEILSTTE